MSRRIKKMSHRQDTQTTPIATTSASSAFEERNQKVMTTTIDNFAGYEITKHITLVRSVIATFHTIPEEEERAQIELLDSLEARSREAGGNAIVGLRLNTVCTDLFYHLTAYGTACIVRPIGDSMRETGAGKVAENVEGET